MMKRFLAMIPLYKIFHVVSVLTFFDNWKPIAQIT